MRYTFLTVKSWNGTGYINTDMPILASDDLYNRMPEDINQKVTLLSGRQEGYTDITLFFADVCNAVGFNPFKVKKYGINSTGASTIEKDVLDAFMSDYELNNSGLLNYYPDSNYDIGGTWLNPGYGDFQATMGQTMYGGESRYNVIFYHTLILNSFFTTNDGTVCEFEIWPEDAIVSGVINTGHFQRDNNNLIKTCHLFINIWKNETTGLYNFNVQIGGGYYNSTRTNRLDNQINGANLGHIYNPSNPMDNKEQEGDEGGNGAWDNDDQGVPIPDLPSIDITALGGFHLWRLEAADFAALMNYLTSNAPGDSILKWFSNPIQAITACYMLPYPAHAAGTGSITVLGMPTGVSAYKAEQWEQYNLGSVYINTRYGDCFLDYAPQTRVSMYLPFCGVKQLNADDVIGHNVGVVYHLDNISGACVAYITIDAKVRYTFTGSCAIGIPISQSNWGQTYIAAATAAAGALAGGMGAAGAAIQQGESALGIGMSAAAGAVQGGGGLSAFESKPTVSRSGNFSGAGSALGVPHPFLIIERPDKSKIGDPKSIIGITSSRVLPLGSLKGFNSISQCHLHGIDATMSELEEIERLLYEGVIF